MRARIWFIASVAAALTISCSSDEPPSQERSMERLRALPYVGQTPVRSGDQGKLGVQIHDADSAYPGINVDCAESRAGVRLLDMQGQPLHTIETRPCKLIEPYDDETFVMLVYPSGILRIDWQSNVLWHNPGFYHHDFDVTAEGEIWVITTRARQVEYRGRALEIRDDELVRLGPDGEERDGFSLFDVVTPVLPPEPLDRLYEAVVSGGSTQPDEDISLEDVLHANTVELLEEDSVLGPAGAILTCMRHADLLVVIEPSSRRVTWSYGPGELDMPHQPTVLANGNLLVFDNGGRRGWSRIIELDPHSRQIVWEYGLADPLFFSRSRGSVQALPNGNVLAAESDRGRVFEVTRDGRVVWDYWAPESREADGTFLRRTIYRSARWTPETVGNPEFLLLWQSTFQNTTGQPR